MLRILRISLVDATCDTISLCMAIRRFHLLKAQSPNTSEGSLLSSINRLSKSKRVPEPIWRFIKRTFLIGPKSDPVKVGGGKDIQAAFQKI